MFPDFCFDKRRKKTIFAKTKYNKTKTMRFPALTVCIFLALLCCSCTKKKTTRAIVTKVETPKVNREIRAMEEDDVEKTFMWNGVSCKASVSRRMDKDLPVVSDADGNKYYDNLISLSVTCPSGKMAEHTFLKSDFSSYISTDYIKPEKSALLNLVFNKVQDGRALFIATIGSPDDMDDEYMLVEVILSETGGISMAKAEETEE